MGKQEICLPILKKLKTKIMGVRLVFILLVILYITKPVYSQPLNKPSFKEAEPLWMIYLENKNFINTVPNNISASPYTTFVGNLDFVIVDSFKVSVMKTLTDRLQTDGFIIEKTNFHTGRVIWSDIYNFYNGAEGYFSMTGKLYVNKDGNIVITGNRGYTYRDLNGYYQCFARIYDFESGKVLNMFTDFSETPTIPERYGSVNGLFLPINNDSAYIHPYYVPFGEEDSDTTRYKTVFKVVNIQMNSIFSENEIEFEMAPKVPVYWNSRKNYTNKKLNDSLMVVFVSWEPAPGLGTFYETRLICYNYKDPNNIHIAWEKDLSDKVIFNWFRPSNVEIDIINGDIFIMDWETPNLGITIHAFMLRLDAYGNEISYFRDIKYQNSKYENVTVLHVNDTLLYALCYPAIKSNYGYDIITIDNDGTTNYIASVTLKDHLLDDYFKSIRSHELINGKILFLHGYFQNSQSGDLSYWNVAFDLDDLIQGSLVNVEGDQWANESELNIYPNPATHHIKIQSPLEISNIALSDISGRVWMNLQNPKEEIDISHLPNGIYVATITTETDKKVRKKVVKIN